MAPHREFPVSRLVRAVELTMSCRGPVVFPAPAESGYVTGHTLAVDGGGLAR